MNLKGRDRRYYLAEMNSCHMKNCQFYDGNICTHEQDCVDTKTGIDSCPLVDKSVNRENFKG